MHSLRKVYFCVEKLTFSIHLNLSPYKYVWKNTIDLGGRRVMMPSGLVLFCFLVSILELVSRAGPAAEQSGRAGCPERWRCRCGRARRDPRSAVPTAPRRARPLCWEQEGSPTDLAVLEPTVQLCPCKAASLRTEVLACHETAIGGVNFSSLPLRTVF